MCRLSIMKIAAEVDLLKTRSFPAVVIACSLAMVLALAACQKSSNSETSSATSKSSEAPSPSSTRASAGPVDVCGVITPQVAESVLGPLPSQPPSKTDSAGFGIYDCMYVGPKISGEGAQTVFSRLTVSTGAGKDAGDMLQMDADKQHATSDLPGVGDSAKRNAAGAFVWAKKGDRYCTAQISNGLPRSLTPDQAATKLGDLCQKLFAK